MKNKIIIREAVKRDAKDIVNLLKQVADYHRKFDKYYRPSSSYKNLERAVLDSLGNRGEKVVLAESDGKIVGYCAGAMGKAPNYTALKKIGSIDTMIVDEKHRKSGVGEKLCKELMSWFKEKKIKHIELEVDTRNNPGINFWRKAGFFEYRLKMRKDLK